MSDTPRILRQVPLFSILPDAELMRLAYSLRQVAIAPGTILFHEGDHGSHFYVVVEGQLEIVKAAGTPDERLIAVRGPGQFIGEMSLFNLDGLRTATVRSTAAAQVLEMTREDFNALLHRQPMIAYEMVRVMSERLNSAHNAIIRDLQQKNRQLTDAYEALKAAQAQIIEKEKLERELQLAHDIQMSLLPRRMPELAGYSFGARLVPARAVGGDLYDFISLGRDKVGVVIGDVTDKGVPAAIFMAQAHALLRAEASRAASPREALENANRHLVNMNARGLFVTVLYGVLDGPTGEFTYARAGHEQPMICDAHGDLLPLRDIRAMALGLWADPPLDEQTVILPRGGTLLLYTDGVTEAQNPSKEFFGHEPLAAALRTCCVGSAQAICDSILQQVNAHSGSALYADDVTLVAVHAE